MSEAQGFTVWTVQKRAALNTCLTYDYFCPDFEKSDYLSRIPDLKYLYDMLLEAYNNMNSETLKGLVFSFCLEENGRISSFTNYEQFKWYITQNRSVVQSLWKSFEAMDCVILKLRLCQTNNPLYIDFNNFQLLMPPITILPPYTEDYFKNLVDKWTSGQYVKGILNSGLVQAHLPALVKEDLLGVYPMFTI